MSCARRIERLRDAVIFHVADGKAALHFGKGRKAERHYRAALEASTALFRAGRHCVRKGRVSREFAVRNYAGASRWLYDWVDELERRT